MALGAVCVRFGFTSDTIPYIATFPLLILYDFLPIYIPDKFVSSFAISLDSEQQIECSLDA
jgi:hypothetical protein